MDSESLSDTVVQKPQCVIKKNNHRNRILNILLKILTFAFISSDVFKDNGLHLFSGTVSGGDVSLFGMLIQCIIMILAWACIEKYF
jgi:hypothetical protein